MRHARYVFPTATEVTRLVARRERVPPLIDEADAQRADEQRQAILQRLIAWNGELDGVDPLVAELTTHLQALDELADATYGRRQPSPPPSTEGVTAADSTRSPARSVRPSTSVSFADDLLSARTAAGTARAAAGNTSDADSSEDDGRASTAAGARPHSVARTSDRWSRPSTAASVAARSARPMSVAATVGGWSTHGAASPARSESAVSVDIRRLVPRVVVEPAAEPASPADEAAAAGGDDEQGTMQVAASADASPPDGPRVASALVDVAAAAEVADEPPSTAVGGLLRQHARPTPAAPTADAAGWLAGTASRPMLNAPSPGALLHSDGPNHAPQDEAPPAPREPLPDAAAEPAFAALPEASGDTPVRTNASTSELPADPGIPCNTIASAAGSDPAPTRAESLAAGAAPAGPISAALDAPTPVDLAELLGDHM